jgi:hypothetical protein
MHDCSFLMEASDPRLDLQRALACLAPWCCIPLVTAVAWDLWQLRQSSTTYIPTFRKMYRDGISAV